VNREVLDVENLQPLERYVESVWADVLVAIPAIHTQARTDEPAGRKDVGLAE
jgi:hypothetical protein